MSTDLVPTEMAIVGDPEHVAMALRVQHRRGRLLTAPSAIRYQGLADGRVATRVSLMLPPTATVPAPVRTSPRRRLLAWGDRHPIGMALAFVLTLLLIALSLIALLMTLLAEAMVAAGGIALGAVALAVFVLIAASGSGGHQSGYGYHWTKCQ